MSAEQSSFQTIIQPSLSNFKIDFKEIVKYRDLLWFLIRRDLIAVYKQTVLGPLWFVIQPLIMTLVFTVIFGNVANIRTDGIPHFIFYMSGTIMWNYFQACLNYVGNALHTNSALFSKVYFPRLIVPLSGVLGNLAHFVLNFSMFLLFFIYYYFFTEAHLILSPWVTLYPLVIIHCGVIGLGFGLWIAALTTRYQDLRFALPLAIQMWMYATPIVYPASLVSEKWLWLLWLNPMSVVIEYGRYAFTGTGLITPQAVLSSLGITVLILVSGLFMFNKVQRTFVDTI